MAQTVRQDLSTYIVQHPNATDADVQDIILSNLANINLQWIKVFTEKHAFGGFVSERSRCFVIRPFEGKFKDWLVKIKRIFIGFHPSNLPDGAVWKYATIAHYIIGSPLKQNQIDDAESQLRAAFNQQRHIKVWMSSDGTALDADVEQARDNLIKETCVIV